MYLLFKTEKYPFHELVWKHEVDNDNNIATIIIY